MSLFIPGTPCSLCGTPMNSATDVVMFSPFVADRSDPLFVFSDATVHAACFTRHPLSEEARKWHDEAARHIGSDERVCAACGNPIVDPDDYFGTGLLTRDTASSLFEFNFVHLHRSHAGSWKHFDEFRRRIETAHASGSWKGPNIVFGKEPGASVNWNV